MTSQVLRGERVGLPIEDNGTTSVYYAHLRLGGLDLERRRLDLPRQNAAGAGLWI